jgi:hypothetical protein
MSAGQLFYFMGLRLVVMLDQGRTRLRSKANGLGACTSDCLPYFRSMVLAILHNVHYGFFLGGVSTSVGKKAIVPHYVI